MFTEGKKILSTVAVALALAAVAVPGLRAEVATVGPSGVDPRPLTEILEELGRHYGVFFTYDVVQLAGTSVEFSLREDEELESAVTRLLESTDLNYDVFGEKYLVLYTASKSGRRDAGRLRRKVRQLNRLERRSGEIGLIRGDGDATQRLKEISRTQDNLEVSRTVSGRVTDGEGEPLTGVSIQLVGTARGSFTDANGRFTQRLDGPAGELEFSYLGFHRTRVPAQGGKSLSIEMRSAETALPEVLIIGYGTVSTVDATASVAQIEASDLAHAQAINTPHEWLNGRVAGVQVLGGNGDPGSFQSIRIRGASSMNASNEPLYVIDGMPVDNSPHLPNGLQPGRNPLNALNPSDVARVTVLKDAAAGAIYGSRAANGVVLIETKRGQLLQPGKWSYGNWFAVATPARRLEVFDAAGYRKLVAEIAPHRIDELGTADTDWQNTILHPSLSQQHTLSYAVGKERTAYRASLGYLHRNSTAGDAGSRRASLALNVRHQALDRQLKLTGDLKVSALRDRFILPVLLSYAYAFNPTQPVRDGNERWGGYFEYDNDLTVKNPLSEAEQVDDVSHQLRYFGHLRAEYLPNFLPGLTATLFVGQDRTTGKRELTAPATVRYQYADGGEYRLARQFRNNRLWETYLNYQRRLSGRRLGLKFTGGYTYQHFRADYPETRLRGNDRETTSRQEPENRLASVFGRANFDWRHRYYLTASFRVDGSSRFSSEHRWATFPAVSAAWRVGEEKFLANRPAWIGELKLRAGWGITGNQEIGDFKYLPTYTYGDDAVRYPFGNDYVVTARPNAVSNNLKWEQTASFNLALEAAFYGDRLRTTLEMYRATTHDLLSSVVVPAGSNFSDIVLTNVGSIYNRGVELSADVKVLAGTRVQWDIALNLATNRNRILSLGPTPDLNFRAISTGTITGGTGNTIQLYRVGEALNTFHVFTHLQDESGKPRRDGIDYNGDGTIDLSDMYADSNADGLVNQLDRHPYEQPAPRLFGGVQSRLRSGRWGLQTSLRMQTGNYVYNNLAVVNESYNRILAEPELLNVTRSVTEVGFAAPQYFSDYYVEDASFLRMDALTLDYTAKERAGRPSLRLYVTLQNVFTLTSYRGLDPEIGNVSGDPSVPRYGIDDLVFPRSRSWLVGMNSSF